MGAHRNGYQAVTGFKTNVLLQAMSMNEAFKIGCNAKHYGIAPVFPSN